MRLVSLELEKYGAYTGRVLNFRPDARAHIVFGVNEAGKSTALMAVADLLFGIEDMRHAFLHKAPDLRIRGTLVSKAGAPIEFARRKGNKSTLLNSAGAALHDDALIPWLGGLTRPVFRRAFGLTSRELREGADELLKTGGDVGESLMAAASGVRGLGVLRKRLNEDADAIFAKTRSNKRLFYQAYDRFEAARKAIGDRELLATDWRGLRDDIDAHARKLEDLASRRKDVAVQLTRITRLSKLMPMLTAIDLATEALAPLAIVADVPRGFGERLGDGLAALTMAEKSRAEAADNLELANDELSSIAVDRELLARGAEVGAIYRDLGNYKKLLVDRPRVRAEADTYNADAQRLAGELGFGHIDDLADRQPTLAMLAEINKLIRDGDHLENQRRQIEETLSTEREALAKLERHGATRGAPINPAPLREKLAAFGDVVGLTRERDRETARLSAEERALAEEAKRLSPAIAGLEAAATCVPPSATTIAGFRVDFEQRDQALRDAKANLEGARVEVGRVEARLRELAGDHPVPSTELIGEARARRDRDWIALRATLFGEAGALSGSALSTTVARFETSGAAADRLADEAMRDAERVSAHKAAITELEARQAREQEALERHTEIAAERGRDMERWRALWRPMGVEPLSPRDMTTWLSALSALLERYHKLSNARDVSARMDRELAGLKPGLELLASESGLPPIAGLDAARVATRVAERLKTIEAAWAEARDEKTRREDTKARIENRRRDLDQLCPKLDAWTEAWSEALAQIGLAESVSREAASAALTAWKQAPAVMEARDKAMKRIQGIVRDVERFESDAGELVDSLAPDLARLSPADAVEALHKRLDSARADSVRHDGATKRRSELDRALATATTSLAKARDDLDTIAALAPAGSDLAILRETLKARDDAHAELEKSRANFRLVADGHDEDDARADLADFDIDRAMADRDALQREEDRLDQEAKEVYAALETLKRRASDLQSGVGAEVVAQQKRNAEAELRQLARDWAVLKTGELLLETALERQRAARKDPLLARASAFFSAMTGGAFAGVEQHFDDDDEPRLVARRAGGELVGLTDPRKTDRGGLSEGTADQLYMALRLAYVEDYATRSEPAPFIADDLFTSFDDRRTGFAMETLGQLGEHTQTIVFTHHRHVVDLAIASLGAAADVIELQ